MLTKSFKVTLIISIIAIIFLTPFIWLSLPNINSIEIKIPKTNESIYFNIEHGGYITSWQYTYISTVKMNLLNYGKNHINDYTTNELTNFLYKVNNDTLIIYSVFEFEKPQKFNSKTYIKIIVLPVSRFLDLHENYKTQGLSEIPMYGIIDKD